MVDQPNAPVQAAPPAGLDEFLLAPDAPAAAAPKSQVLQDDGAPIGLDAFIEPEMKEEKYGGLGQGLMTAAEGAASAATFGGSTAVQIALGADPENIRNRREVNPILHGAGQAAGLVGTAWVPGLGEANAAKVMAGAGKVAAEMVGLGAAKTVVQKIGSAAVAGAVENAMFQAGDTVSKILTKDPNVNVGSAAAEIGLAGLVGGAFGGGASATGALWHATVGPKVAGALNHITNRLGGIEGQAFNAIDDVAARADMKLSPITRAALSDEPFLQNQVQAVAHSYNGKAGNEVRENFALLNKSADEVVLHSLGTSSDLVSKLPEMSLAEEGKRVVSSVHAHIEAKAGPIAREFEAINDQFGHIAVDMSSAEKAILSRDAKKELVSKMGKLTQEIEHATDPGKAINAHAELGEVQAKLAKLSEVSQAAGTIDGIAADIMAKAQEMQWATSPSSNIMREVKRVLRELPLQKTIRDLDGFERMIGANTKGALDPALARAGMEMKSIIREARGDLLVRELGAKNGAAAAERFRAIKQEYGAIAEVAKEINSRLKLKNPSVRGWLKNLKEAGATDSETMLNRLSGRGDAHLLQYLSDTMPEAAQALKQHHVNALIQRGVSKKLPGNAVNAGAIAEAVKRMSPEMKAFTLGEKSLAKIEAVDELMSKLKVAKLDKIPEFRVHGDPMSTIGGAMGMVYALSSGHLGAGVLVGAVAKLLGKGAPDAVRLALLKFMGSNKPISAGAFKATVEALQATIKGEAAINRVTKDLFSATVKVGGSAVATTIAGSERSRAKLDAMVTQAQVDPTMLQNVGVDQAHYDPGSSIAMSETTMRAMQYLASQRPVTGKGAPLDSKTPVPPGQMAHYNRMLDIANSPLIVASRIKAGNLTQGEVDALKTMYPGLYSALSSGYLENMAETTRKGKNVPYKTRIGLSMFLGMPLDSTLTGPSILLAQPKKAQRPQQGLGGTPGTPPSSSSMRGINKMPASFQTADQARTAHAQKR